MSSRQSPTGSIRTSLLHRFRRRGRQFRGDQPAEGMADKDQPVHRAAAGRTVRRNRRGGQASRRAHARRLGRRRGAGVPRRIDRVAAGQSGDETAGQAAIPMARANKRAAARCLLISTSVSIRPCQSRTLRVSEAAMISVSADLRRRPWRRQAGASPAAARATSDPRIRRPTSGARCGSTSRANRSILSLAQLGRHGAEMQQRQEVAAAQPLHTVQQLLAHGFRRCRR